MNAALRIMGDLLSILQEPETDETEHKSPPTLSADEYTTIRSDTFSNKNLCDEMMNASIDWALSNGLTMGSPTVPNTSIHAPHTLLPVVLVRSEHRNLTSISLNFHKLIDALSRDFEFLISSIGPTAESDADFTGKMVNLLKRQIAENGISQRYQLGIFRFVASKLFFWWKCCRMLAC